jgi:hypothetical protein
VVLGRSWSEWTGRAENRAAGRPERDDQGHQRGARVWMDGDLAGVGKSDHSRLRGGGETDQFQMLCYEPATGAMVRMLCSRMLESALMVTSRQALFSSASLQVWSLC